ncbi:MAG: aldo/keto reductase [Kiritimatiellia bacterium]
MELNRLRRRDVLKHISALTGAAVFTPRFLYALTAGKRSATDQISLGNTGIKMSRLGMGTGSRGGSIQEALGRDGLCQLVKTAFDKGITYFDCAHNYRSFKWMGSALGQLPRKDLFVLSKVWGTPDDPMKNIEDQLRTLQTDYLDCIMCHCATKSTWTSDRERVMETMTKAKEQGKVRSVGVSCHSMEALEVASRADWVQVNLVRVNPQARYTDRYKSTRRKTAASGIEPVLNEISEMKKNGHGVIGMKLVGNGDFKDPEDREKAMRFVISNPDIDAATVGFKNAAEIDESIRRMNNALKSA